MKRPRLNSADLLLAWWASRFVAAGFVLGLLVGLVVAGSP